MRAKTVNEAFGQKDETRMIDIRTKAVGDHDKEISLATTQARIIKNPAKAAARGEAAEEVFGSGSDIAQIFFDRASELRGGGQVSGVASKGILAPVKQAPGKGEKLEREFKTEFFLPSERIRSTAEEKGGGFKRGVGVARGLGIGRFANSVEYEDEWKGEHNPIASLGFVNLKTGHSKYFNLHDTWGSDSTGELWRTSSGKLKLIFTSGKKPLFKLGNRTTFFHDQTGARMFDAQLIDYVNLSDMKELIRKYEKSSISGYTYK